MSKRPTESGDWSSDSAALFHASRSDHEPTAADRARVRNALAERLAGTSNAPVASGDVPAALLGKSASGAAIGKFLKIGVGIAFVMIGALVIQRAVESKNRTESIPSAPAPIAAAKKPPERAPEPARPTENAAPVPSDEPISAAVPSTRSAPVERVAPKRTRAQGAAANPARAAERSQPKLTAAEPVRAASQTARTPLRAGESTAAGAPRVSGVTGATGMGGVASAAGGANDTGASRAAAESVASDAPVRPASEPAANTNAAARAPVEPALAPREGAQPSAATATSTTSKLPPRPAAQAPADDEESADARAELAFVVRINRAMQESKFRTVLTLCVEHERRWPKGTFAQEREGLRAIASCGSGATGADARARKFFAAYPRGALAPRVREACATQLAPAVAKKSVASGQADPK